MASQGPNSPGTMADDATVGTVAWSNPDNAKISDNVYTTTVLTASDSSHYLVATNFGFAIPTGATINGLLAEVEDKVDANGPFSFWGYAIKGGVVQTPRFALGTITTTETYNSYGSSTDLWGETWTAEDINALDFGIVFQRGKSLTTTNTFSVDHIRITVYYTEAATGTNCQVNIGDAWKPIEAMQINIGDVWKPVASAKVNIGDDWKDIF